MWISYTNKTQRHDILAAAFKIVFVKRSVILIGSKIQELKEPLQQNYVYSWCMFQIMKIIFVDF